MPRITKPTAGKEHIVLHKDGSLWAKGRKLKGEMHGYWEWFRKNGVRMRSGFFDKGAQVGKWTTYDAKGKVYKVTLMKAKRTQRKGAQPCE